jgi:pilus assembly protein Flp/PilA
MKLIALLLEFLREEEGQDLIEYALLVGPVSLVCIVALTAAGSQVNVIFDNVKNRLTTATANT